MKEENKIRIGKYVTARCSLVVIDVAELSSILFRLFLSLSSLLLPPPPPSFESDLRFVFYQAYDHESYLVRLIFHQNLRIQPIMLTLD
ncbi:hypothetical protein DERP_013548 [Dermatophagoides pteronyssinus]|uniref:Uncharacterized protein n=1 Tax=Dermatophagoides pteronyssinus TaxID=6956 RepID=A0ABQ8IXQ4_DERPT|nr:hypothetical protein DERP_013548 [Dermatophagoides pteronyssinus]